MTNKMIATVHDLGTCITMRSYVPRLCTDPYHEYDNNVEKKMTFCVLMTLCVHRSLVVKAKHVRVSTFLHGSHMFACLSTTGTSDNVKIIRCSMTTKETA